MGVSSTLMPQLPGHVRHVRIMHDMYECVMKGQVREYMRLERKERQGKRWGDAGGA